MSESRSVSGLTTRPTRLYAERQLVVDTKISSEERTSAALVAGVIVLGITVVILFAVWLTLFSNQPNWNHSLIMVGTSDLSEANEDTKTPDGFIDDWQAPGVDEFDVERPQLMDALEAVNDSVSAVRSGLEAVDSESTSNGRGPGFGDNRKRGLVQEIEILPEWERWSIEYSASSRDEYITMLGKLKITLGAVSQLSDQVVFVNELSADTPAKTTGDRESDEAKRLYFRVRNDRLRGWEKAFLTDQAVEIENRIVVHFMHDDIRTELMKLEREVFEAAGKSIEEVKKTRFAVRAKADDSLEYYVVQEDGIEYRPKPADETPSESSKASTESN